MGYLTKKGAVVKNWKRRYFVAKPDYSVDYFESEEVSKLFLNKEKKKSLACLLKSVHVLILEGHGLHIILAILSEKVSYLSINKKLADKRYICITLKWIQLGFTIPNENKIMKLFI